MRTILVFCALAVAVGCGKPVTASESNVNESKVNKSNAGENSGYNLKIRLQGVRGTEGNVVIAVYDSKRAFDDNGEPLALMSIPAGSQSITVTDFPRRKIAIAAFHDTNRNGEYDMQGDSPLEGWGNSGDISQWSEPTFEAALVTAGLVTVRMHYFK